MNKFLRPAALGLTVAALAGLAIWALNASDSDAHAKQTKLGGVPEEVVRAERILEAPTPPVEASAAPEVAKNYTPATDYAHPEDVPWSAFKDKKNPLKLRPNRILEDGTIEYVDVPMIRLGKRTFGTMTAKPTETAPILEEGILEDRTHLYGSGSRAPVVVPSTPSRN